MNRIGRAGLGLGVCTVATLSAGCNHPALLKWNYPHAETATLSETPEEHLHRVSRIAERDRRALQEDLDIVFHTDRPTRLSRWHSR